jgi:hypothetical protein
MRDATTCRSPLCSIPPSLSLQSSVENSPLNITDASLYLYSIPTHTDKMPRKAAEPKEAKPAGEKKASGLTKPCTLSAELAAIVGAKKDEKLAR